MIITNNLQNKLPCIDHLEISPPDSYNRPPPEPGPIHKDVTEEYIVERIIRKEMRSTSRRRSKQDVMAGTCHASYTVVLLAEGALAKTLYSGPLVRRDWSRF
jgi:hypothetical protein